MLLQTVKSRNLWLWGEKVVPYMQTPEVDTIKADIQDLKKQQASKQVKLLAAGKNSDVSLPETETLNKELQQIKSDISSKTKSLTTALAKASILRSEFNYTRTFTDPFKITALQDVSITWENQVGESYGIKANFLQSWHNKPVNISFSGLSYIGAFGGETVGELTNKKKEKESFINKLKNAAGASAISSGISTATNWIQDTLNSDSSTAEVNGKYNTVMDYDIYKINKLLSLYGEGMYKESGAGSASSWIHLLIENEPSQDGSTSYVTFIGHLKNFQYKESVSKPFIYEFTCQFIGEPTITKTIGEGEIKAKQDANSLKLSVISSNSGYSLGYGF